MKKLQRSLPLLLAGLVLIGTGLLGGQVASAQDSVPGDGTPDDGKYELDRRCLSCHATTDAETTFADGETRNVHVDVAAFNASQHGASNPDGYLSCFDCHGDYTYPHDEVEWESPRDFRVTLNEQCQDCHTAQTDRNLDSVHGEAFAAGDQSAANCIDCHGYHEVGEPDVPRADISLTCGSCHEDILTVYAESVHGEALLEESNPDVPTCIDCHGVHDINDPTTTLFRNRSPQLCADCHADEELMGKYDISTDVFETYVDDFHGTTVTLFEHQDPTVETNKAVCYDCHGVHNIKSPDDPESTTMEDNLLETCQQCHRGAEEAFVDTWASHYIPSPQNNPIVYYIDIFYLVFIPGVLTALTLVVGVDAYRRIKNAITGGGNHHGDD